LIFLVCAGTRISLAQTDPVLERYITLALAQNPRIAAAASRTEAAAERVPQMSALPDPMLGFGLKELSLNDPTLTATEMTGRWISLEQEFPFPGKRGLSKRMAEADRDMTAAEADETRAMLIADVKMAYYEWAYLRAATDLVQQSKELMRHSADLAASALSVGVGSQSDVLRAQTELTRFDVELSDLRQREQTAIADINVCCTIPLGTQTTPPSPLEYRPVNISYDSLLAMIEQNAPRARMASFRVAASQSDAALAKRGYLPDLRVGVEYMRRGKAEPEDMVSLMVGTSLPLYWRRSQDRALEEKRIEHRRAREEQQSVANDLRFELTDLWAKAASLREQIETYENGIVPQAQQTFEAAQAGYVTGRVDFMTLVSAQMMWLEAERDRLMKVADYNTTWGRIEALAGQRVP